MQMLQQQSKQKHSGIYWNELLIIQAVCIEDKKKQKKQTNKKKTKQNQNILNHYGDVTNNHLVVINVIKYRIVVIDYYIKSQYS